MRVAAIFLSFLLLSHSFILAFANDDDSYFHQICESIGLSGNACCAADTALKVLGYGGLAFAVGTYGVPFVLAKLGFASVGIASGSVAAFWQASGKLPSIFSALQSGAMSGAAASISSKVGVGLAVVKSYCTGCDKKESKKH